MSDSSSSHIPRGRRRLAVDIDEELADELDAAVAWLDANTPYTATKVAVVTRGLELALEELRAEHDVDDWSG